MGQATTKKSLRDIIYENDQCAKQAKKQLKRFDKLREAISLDKGASTTVINNLSASDPDLQEAYKQLHEIGFNPDTEEKVLRKGKKRNRINKVIRGKLQI